MRRLGAAIAIVVVVACTGRQYPVTPAPDPNAGKRYAPLAFKADAKLPNQGVVLGVDERDRSTVVPLPAVPARTIVDAITVGVAPNTDGTAHVGFHDASGAAISPAWRAGVWTAAFVAAHALGKDVTELRFTVSNATPVDANASSALVAAAFLATITGTAVDPNATIIGAIQGDGTIAPATDLSTKLRAAAASGKRRIGHPGGSAIPTDIAAELVEVATVHDAYRVLTGATLPATVAVPARDMALDAATTRALETAYKATQQRLATEWATLLTLQQAGRLPATLRSLSVQAQRTAEDAERLFKQKLTAAAYIRMLSAWIVVATTTRSHAILSKVQAGDFSGARDVLAATGPAPDRVAAAFTAIHAAPPTTLAGYQAHVGALQSALRAHAFHAVGTRRVAGATEYIAALASRAKNELASPALADEVVTTVAPALHIMLRTEIELALATDRLHIEALPSPAYAGAQPALHALATALQAAASAKLAHVDALLGDDTAHADTEPDYVVARATVDLARDSVLHDLRTTWGETSPGWTRLVFAAHALAYAESSQLVTTFDILGATPASTKPPDAAALATLLARAELAARVHARAARVATGSIPPHAKLSYQLAASQRDGDPLDQLGALGAYWTSSLSSQLAVLLARN